MLKLNKHQIVLCLHANYFWTFNLYLCRLFKCVNIYQHNSFRALSTSKKILMSLSITQILKLIAFPKVQSLWIFCLCNHLSVSPVSYNYTSAANIHSFNKSFCMFRKYLLRGLIKFVNVDFDNASLTTNEKLFFIFPYQMLNFINNVLLNVLYSY